MLAGGEGTEGKGRGRSCPTQPQCVTPAQTAEGDKYSWDGANYAVRVLCSDETERSVSVHAGL